MIDALDGPVTLAVEAEGLRAESVVRPQPPSRETRLSDTGRARADVAVDGYILTPEVGGAAILSAGVENASKTVEIRGDDPSLAIGPERITLDACGMSTLYATRAAPAAGSSSAPVTRYATVCRTGEIARSGVRTTS